MLKEKVALVTGGGSGIGREIALKFAEEGAKVMVSDVDVQAGADTVSLINKREGIGLFFRSNTSVAAECEDLVSHTVRQWGALHIAVNNAGISGEMFPTADYPLESWLKVISVNLSGVFFGMKYQIPALLKSGGGSIVNIASILGQVGFANSVAYVAAKHGVVGITQNAALEYSSQGIRINSVAPGFIKTPMIEKAIDANAMKTLASLHPIGRLGEASEVAELVLWLSSVKASFVTGACYPVDGGYLAR